MLDRFANRWQARAKTRLRNATCAPDRAAAEKAIWGFWREFSTRYPSAAECLHKSEERLLVHFDFPAEHWQPLRTTNPIEPPYATVECAQDERRSIARGLSGHGLQAGPLRPGSPAKSHRPYLAALARAGVPFKDGEARDNP